MKKTVALMLCLLMAVSLAACGSQTAADESNNTQSTDLSETASSGTDESEQPEDSEESVEAVPDESEEETPAFDTSWASNEFEAMIPELPFTGWTVVEETDTVYELELGGLRTANGADTATGFEEDKDALIAYINSLPAYGFTVEETGENYSWVVTNSEGNTVEFICGDGYCWVTFNRAN